MAGKAAPWPLGDLCYFHRGDSTGGGGGACILPQITAGEADVATIQECEAPGFFPLVANTLG